LYCTSTRRFSQRFSAGNVFLFGAEYAFLVARRPRRGSNDMQDKSKKRIVHHAIRLATPADARRIAGMSRDFIETGLGWRWTSDRVLQCMHDAATNVIVAEHAGRVTGFAIMEYADESAHLLLLAVQEPTRRRGIGAAMVAWLETTALIAGIGAIHLDSRAGNGNARAFYRALGYNEIKMIPRFYRGREDGVRIAKDLWPGA
jgi:ribosomal-protein-alanine N-acetyltransferase